GTGRAGARAAVTARRAATAGSRIVAARRGRGLRRGDHGTVPRDAAGGLDVLELVEVGDAVGEARIAIVIARTHGRGSEAGGDARGDARVRPRRGAGSVEVEAEVVELRARHPPEVHRVRSARGAEVHQLHRGRGGAGLNAQPGHLDVVAVRARGGVE